jgi:hypothetical protein
MTLKGVWWLLYNSGIRQCAPCCCALTLYGCGWCCRHSRCTCCLYLQSRNMCRYVIFCICIALFWKGTGGGGVVWASRNTRLRKLCRWPLLTFLLKTEHYIYIYIYIETHQPAHFHPEGGSSMYLQNIRNIANNHVVQQTVNRININIYVLLEMREQ